MADLAPCKGCTDRCVGCHGSCLRYIDWQQKRAVIKADMYRQNSIDGQLRRMNKNRQKKAHDYYYREHKKNT